MCQGNPSAASPRITSQESTREPRTPAGKHGKTKAVLLRRGPSNTPSCAPAPPGGPRAPPALSGCRGAAGPGARAASLPTPGRGSLRAHRPGGRVREPGRRFCPFLGSHTATRPPPGAPPRPAGARLFTSVCRSGARGSHTPGSEVLPGSPPRGRRQPRLQTLGAPAPASPCQPLPGGALPPPPPPHATKAVWATSASAPPGSSTGRRGQGSCWSAPCTPGASPRLSQGPQAPPHPGCLSLRMGSGEPPTCIHSGLRRPPPPPPTARTCCPLGGGGWGGLPAPHKRTESIHSEHPPWVKQVWSREDGAGGRWGAAGAAGGRRPDDHHLTRSREEGSGETTDGRLGPGGWG